MIFFYISLSTYLCFLVIKLHKGLITLDKSKFDLKKYHKNVFNKDNFLTPELLGIIIIIIAFNSNAKVTGVCMVILYTLLFLYFLREKQDKLSKNKKVVSTAVITGLIYISIFSLFLIDYLDLQNDFLIFDNSKLYYTITIIIGYLAYYIIFLSGLITNIFSKLFKKQKKKK
ncbi:MAG: hypothetical protein IJ093_02225 [Bacilli bacterium]|nr:hypothetical protein [Bacilli bacterium]